MDKKSILIGALGASLLFVTIGSGTQQEQATNTTVPESQVWEMHFSTMGNQSSAEGRCYVLNTETGEVRKYSRTYPTSGPGKNSRNHGRDYITMEPQIMK